MSEPTLGEVVREMARIAAQMSALAARLDSDRLTAAQTYVNRETYQSDQRVGEVLHRSISDRVGDLEESRKDEVKWRRQASFNLAVMAAGWLLTIALAFFAFFTR